MNFESNLDMIKLRQKTGKFPVKATVIIVVLILLALPAGCQSPFVARYAQGKIQNGMTASEVNKVVTDLGAREVFCNIKQEELIIGQKCVDLIDSLASQDSIDKAEMTVLFMGPVFLKNDFNVIFGKDRKVLSKTAVRSWD